jgi:hypothetical protein
MWSPAQVGRDFDLTPSSLSPLEPFREHLTIISNTDVRNAEAFDAPEIGGDHFRSSAVFLTQSHPHQTQGSDVRVGTSLDQTTRRSSGRTRHSVDAALHRERGSGRRLLLRLFVRLHRLDQLGLAERAAADGARSRAVPSTSCSASAPRPEDRAARRRKDKQHPRLDHRLGRACAARSGRRTARGCRLPRRRARDRAAHPEASRRSTPPASRASCPGARSACPDSFTEHVKLMFDLQAWPCVRHHARLRLQDGPRRLEPRLPESGVNTGFHIGLAPRRARGPHHRVRRRSTATTSACCRTSSRSSAAQEATDAARQHDGDLRVAHGQLERPQPQAVPAVPAGHAAGPAQG